MRNSSVWSIGKYTIKDGKIYNKTVEIKKTVKGYTVGFTDRKLIIFIIY